jgi:hypothetical protein
MQKYLIEYKTNIMLHFPGVRWIVTDSKWRAIRGDKFRIEKCEWNITWILFFQESQHPRRALVPQLTRPRSQFNANQSIQIKMSPLSPQPRSNNTQQNIQAKFPNYTQTTTNKESSFWGSMRKRVEEDGKEHVQEIGLNNGAPGGG